MSKKYIFKCFIFNPKLVETCDRISKTALIEKLKVDGVWGPKTTSALQELLEVTNDSIVAGQNSINEKYCKAINNSNCWVFVEGGTKKGASVIKAMQKLINTEATGQCDVDTIKAIQTYLKNLKIYQGAINGYLNSNTVKALQKYINKHITKQ